MMTCDFDVSLALKDSKSLKKPTMAFVELISPILSYKNGSKDLATTGQP